MRVWDVEVTLSGNPTPMVLCRCLSVASVVAIVESLVDAEDIRPITIRQVVAPDPPEPVRPREWPEAPL